jgi:hypothetical protein
MTTIPSPDDFSKDEKPGEYCVRFKVKGEILITIKADNIAAAQEKAEDMLEDEDFGLELDEATDVSIRHVYKSPAMFRVLRNGKTMQVTRLEPGDQPREPNERGF